MAILKAGQLDIISHSADQTKRLGARLGALLQAGDFICLSGDMGAGKTVFAIGIGQGWGSALPLTSPTVNLIHAHSRVADKQHLYHIDCYRIDEEDEIDSINLDRLLKKKGCVVMEWPERVPGILPKNRLWIELRVAEPTRRGFSFEAVGPRYEELLNRFRESTFGV